MPGTEDLKQPSVQTKEPEEEKKTSDGQTSQEPLSTEEGQTAVDGQQYETKDLHYDVETSDLEPREGATPIVKRDVETITAVDGQNYNKSDLSYNWEANQWEPREGATPVTDQVNSTKTVQEEKPGTPIRSAVEIAMAGDGQIEQKLNAELGQNDTNTVKEEKKGTPLRTAKEIAMAGDGQVEKKVNTPSEEDPNKKYTVNKYGEIEIGDDIKSPIDERSAEAQATLRQFRDQTNLDTGENIPESSPQRPIQPEEGKETPIDNLYSFGNPISADMEDMTQKVYENSLNKHIEHTDDVLGRMQDQINRANEQQQETPKPNPIPENPDKVEPKTPEIPQEIVVILQQIQKNQEILLQILQKMPEYRGDTYNVTNNISNISEILGQNTNTEVQGDQINIPGGRIVGRDNIEGEGNTGSPTVVDNSLNDVEQNIGNTVHTEENTAQEQPTGAGQQQQQQNVYVGTPGQTPQRTPYTPTTPEGQQTPNINIENNDTVVTVLNNLRNEILRLEQVVENNPDLNFDARIHIENLIGSLKVQINNIEGVNGDVNIDQSENGDTTEVDQNQVVEAANDVVNLDPETEDELREAGETNEGFFATIKKVFKSKGGWKGLITSVTKRLGSSLAVSGAVAGVTAIFGPVGAAVVGGAMVGMGAWTAFKGYKQASAEAKRRGIKTKELLKDKEYVKGLLTGTLTTGVGRATTMLLSGAIPGIGGIVAGTLIGTGIDTGVEVVAEVKKNKAKKDLMEGYEKNHNLRKYNEIKNNEYIGFQESGGDVYAGKKSVNIEKIIQDLQNEQQSPAQKNMAKKIGAATLLEIFNHTENEDYRFISYKDGDETKQLDLSTFKIDETEQSTTEYQTLDFEPTIDRYIDTLDTDQMATLLQEGWNSIDENDVPDLGMKIVKNYAGLESAEIDKILTDERRIYLNSVSFLSGFRTASAVVNGLTVIGVGGVSMARGISAWNEQNTVNRAQGQELQETRDAIQDDDAEIGVYENENGEKVYQVDLDGDNNTDLYRMENGDMVARTNEGAAKIFELDNSLPQDSVSVHNLANSTTGVSGTIVNDNGDVVGVVVDGGNGNLGTMPIENLDAPITATNTTTGNVVDLDIVSVKADGTAIVTMEGQEYQTNIATLDNIPAVEGVEGTAGAGSIPIVGGDSMPTLLRKSLMDAMEYNPKLQEAYTNDSNIMERMLYEGNYHGNDADIRGEIDISNPVQLSDKTFDYADSPSVMNMLQRLNGGDPIYLPDGTDAVAGSPGYTLDMDNIAIDGFGEMTGVESTGASGSVMLGGLLMGVANAFDKDSGNYITRETTIEKGESSTPAQSNGQTNNSTTSSDDDSDPSDGVVRQPSETETRVSTATLENAQSDNEEEKTDPMEKFNTAVKAIMNSSKKNNTKIIIDRAAYTYNEATKTWDYQQIEYGIPYIAKKNLNDAQVLKKYRDNVRVGQNTFEKDIRITLEQFQAGESLRINDVLYRKTELTSSRGSELLWVPAQNSPQEVKERGNLTDANLAQDLKNLGIKGIREQNELETRQASATSESEQSDQEQVEEQENKEKRRKRRRWLRVGLVTAGVVGGVAAGLSPLAGPVAIGAGIATAVKWGIRKIYEKRADKKQAEYTKIMEQAKKRTLTKQETTQTNELMKQITNSKKVVNTCKDLSYLIAPIGLLSGAGAIFEPTIENLGLKVQLDGWLEGFWNKINIIKSREGGTVSGGLKIE